MDLESLNHAQRERILLLDQCLTWKGQANRRDLIVRFEISTAQAAVDFRTYLSLTRTPPVYDATAKTYFSNDEHSPLSDAGPEQVFDLLREESSHLDASIPLPNRAMDPAVVAQLYRAMTNERDILITYTSMNSGLSEPQWISPVRFHFDGEAIHLRAWSHKHGEYRDYLPIRVLKQNSIPTRDRSFPLPFDTDWNQFVRLRICPRSELSDAQARVVRLEYGFPEQTHITVETRKALAFYVMRRWRLNDDKARLQLEEIEEIEL
ncbi:WYL domain-containing protein [Paracoccus laeviglucosivorans]|uniref:Predicted DNA-binding transcriptional regulator YafY, contains an HTH and WYL domains n=1 Tax=Paracoccus laeviglucosivorans TaxID=1197861 RepID=A0A521FSR1_9RHOB|nr:WYL domain-containing protein [Paracoccus laeviglucosivorans]SMO99253.1 Predicted DNA-binding transcriptional regulator YafY, contains an HTH and WYL domains [Paracoccus laeviglucosivorans]